ncbi:hypothetical protein IG631_20893 [Alternaria alternata]|nr:hypothetical protein IG631_20893 [Alternaria alternata]
MFRRLPDAKTSHIRWSRLRLVYQTPIFASWCVCGGSRKIGIRLVTTAHLYFATRDELLKLLGTMQQTWWVASGRSLSRKGRWSGGLAAHVGLVRQLEARGCAAGFPESYRLAICLASSGSQSSEPALEWSNLPPVLRVRLPLVRYSYLGFPKTPERECTPQRTQNNTTADPNSDRRTDSVGQRCILIRRDDWLWLALAFCTVYEMCIS